MTDIKSMTIDELKELMTQIEKSLSVQSRYTVGCMNSGNFL